MKGWRDKCIKTGFDTFQGFLGSFVTYRIIERCERRKKWRCIYYSLDWIRFMISQTLWEMPFLKQEWITKKYCQNFEYTVGHNIWSFLYHDVEWIRSKMVALFQQRSATWMHIIFLLFLTLSCFVLIYSQNIVYC